MKRFTTHILSALVLGAVSAAFAGGCSRGGGKSATLTAESDSLSYVVGMNIAFNILRMDSTLQRDAVLAGINDVLNGREQMTADEALTFWPT